MRVVCTPRSMAFHFHISYGMGVWVCGFGCGSFCFFTILYVTTHPMGSVRHVRRHDPRWGHGAPIASLRLRSLRALPTLLPPDWLSAPVGVGVVSSPTTPLPTHRVSAGLQALREPGYRYALRCRATPSSPPTREEPCCEPPSEISSAIFLCFFRFLFINLLRLSYLM